MIVLEVIPTPGKFRWERVTESFFFFLFFS